VSAGTTPVPDLSFNGGQQKSSAMADGFATSGAFGDFFFGGSGAGIGQPTSNLATVGIVGLFVLLGLYIWKNK